jgi:uncharacterized protein YwqG
MRRRWSIEFVAAKDNSGTFLKFGGLPFGLPVARWPKSKATGEPMQFVAQIPFGPDLFPQTEPSVAFVFITTAPDVDGTWLPNGGENAVVILAQHHLTQTFADEGVSRLHRMVEKWWNKKLVPETCTFTAHLSAGEDPEFATMQEQETWTDKQRADYWSSVEGNKIGGAPGFLQGDEIPFSKPWHLLLQLDSARVPFWINFGDAGIGYAFLNEHGTEGRFLWQCC